MIRHDPDSRAPIGSRDVVVSPAESDADVDAPVIVYAPAQVVRLCSTIRRLMGDRDTLIITEHELAGELNVSTGTIRNLKLKSRDRGLLAWTGLRGQPQCYRLTVPPEVRAGVPHLLRPPEGSSRGREIVRKAGARTGKRTFQYLVDADTVSGNDAQQPDACPPSLSLSSPSSALVDVVVVGASKSAERARARNAAQREASRHPRYPGIVRWLRDIGIDPEPELIERIANLRPDEFTWLRSQLDRYPPKTASPEYVDRCIDSAIRACNPPDEAEPAQLAELFIV